MREAGRARSCGRASDAARSPRGAPRRNSPRSRRRPRRALVALRQQRDDRRAEEQQSEPEQASQNQITLNASRVATRSEEHTSELQSQSNLVCRLLLEKKKI